MPKTYIKVRTSAGKQYHALLGKMISNRSFKTATKAEEYAAIVKDRYQRLKRAEIEMKEFEASDKEDEMEAA